MATGSGDVPPVVPPAVPPVDAGATAWVLACTGFVLIMSLPGLAIFYGGFVRSKNVLSVLAQCFAITAITTVLWMFIGYSLTFTDGGVMNPFIGGLSRVFMAGVTGETMLTRPGISIPLAADAVYQGSYAFLAPAILVGSVVERMRTKAVLWFAGLFLLFVYVPIAHMLWCEGGWMMQWGILDWAGGLVVGTTAGVAGLVACIMVGPRVGYPEKTFRPHNTTLIVIGTGMLWTGWIGFEGGTGLRADGVASMAVITTHTAAAFGALGWTGIEWLLHHGRPSIIGFCAGAVAGLAAITPAAGYVGVMAAAAIGILGAVICYWMAVWVKSKLGWDETLDAFGVHATGGMVGTILVGVLGAPELGGPRSDTFDVKEQLGKQTVGVLFTVAYTVAVSYLLLKTIGYFAGGLRVDPEVERRGLDVAELNDGAYMFGMHNWDPEAAFVADAATRAAWVADRIAREQVAAGDAGPRFRTLGRTSSLRRALMSEGSMSPGLPAETGSLQVPHLDVGAAAPVVA